MKNKIFFFISLLCIGSLSHVLNGAQALLGEQNSEAWEKLFVSGFEPKGELFAALTQDPYAYNPFQPRKVDISEFALEEAARLQANRGTKRKELASSVLPESDSAENLVFCYPSDSAIQQALLEVKKQLKTPRTGKGPKSSPFARQLVSRKELLIAGKQAQGEAIATKKQKRSSQKKQKSLNTSWAKSFVEIREISNDHNQQMIAAYDQQKIARRKKEQHLREIEDDLLALGARAFSAPPQPDKSYTPSTRSKSV